MRKPTMLARAKRTFFCWDVKERRFRGLDSDIYKRREWRTGAGGGRDGPPPLHDQIAGSLGIDELGLNFSRQDALFKTAVEQRLHRQAATFAIIDGPFINIHGDETIGGRNIEPAPELQRVVERFLAMIETVLDALGQDGWRRI